MPTIHLKTFIEAPPGICFDLSRSIELHEASTASTNEKAIAGRTSGLCEKGDVITWEATHFGIRQQLTVQITAMDAPHFFEDKMLRGAFKSMEHQHFFKAVSGGTEMKDVFTFSAPLGFLGKIAENLVLRSYLTRFLLHRNAMIKQEAEKQHSL